MSSRIFLIAPVALFASPYLIGQSTTVPSSPPPVAQAFPPASRPALPAAEQRAYGPMSDTLIARPTVDGVMEGFRKTYRTAETAPRIVVYVNRALVDTGSGLKLVDHTQTYEKTDNSSKTTGTRTYRASESRAATPALADQQTVREVERLFGRAFRNAGAQLADQKTATALLPEEAGAHLTGEQAAKDREALAKVADIAIEILISSRSLIVPGVSGDLTYPVPDIQATAIRLKDSAIVGQAAASDVIGKGAQAGRVLRQFDVSDITEATAVALMEDMLTGAK
jgi:hypothetical protein